MRVLLPRPQFLSAPAPSPRRTCSSRSLSPARPHFLSARAWTRSLSRARGGARGPRLSACPPLPRRYGASGPRPPATSPPHGLPLRWLSSPPPTTAPLPRPHRRGQPPLQPDRDICSHHQTSRCRCPSPWGSRLRPSSRGQPPLQPDRDIHGHHQTSRCHRNERPLGKEEMGDDGARWPKSRMWRDAAEAERSWWWGLDFEACSAAVDAAVDRVWRWFAGLDAVSTAPPTTTRVTDARLKLENIVSEIKASKTFCGIWSLLLRVMLNTKTLWSRKRSCLISYQLTLHQQACWLLSNMAAYFTGSEVRIIDDDVLLVQFDVAFNRASWVDPDSIKLMVMQSMICSWNEDAGGGKAHGF